jgi:hypothetical protein
MKSQSSKTITWHGEQEFKLVGTERFEDTLRVETNYAQEMERTLMLILPTLCITYADMKFTNAVGGEQENYPASSAYGPVYFDPPVVISGEEQVEKLTWIRGAHRVTIGPDKTEIEWIMGRTLVIPRLRLDQKEPATSLLAVPDVPITVERALEIKVMQYADGRHIGGIRVEKRHPEWKPPEEPEEYDLWIRVIDGQTLEPIPEAMLNLFRWHPKKELMYLVERQYTDGHGAIHDSNRPSGELEAVTLNLPGWRAVARCFRPLAGQRVRFHMRAWQLKEDAVPYVWKKGDTLEDVALLTGHGPHVILDRNGLADASALTPGTRIKLPCFAAMYWLEPGDTLEWLAEAFGYSGIKELAELGKLDLDQFDGGEAVLLPGWHFFYARPDDSLDRIDKMFEVPRGSSRTVGRVHHPDPRLPYESETIAVPTKKFVKTRPKRRAK